MAIPTNTDKRTPGHTPLPFEITPGALKSNGYHFSANGCEVIEIKSNPVSEWVCAVRGNDLTQAKVNASFIVRACNNHNALVETLRFCMSVIETQGMYDLSERMAVDKSRKAIKDATD